MCRVVSSFQLLSHADYSGGELDMPQLIVVRTYWIEIQEPELTGFKQVGSQSAGKSSVLETLVSADLTNWHIH